MEYYVAYVKRIIRILVSFFIAGIVILFLTGYIEFLSGWILGSLGNIVYFILLALRVTKVPKDDIAKIEREMKKSLLARFSVIIATIALAIIIPGVHVLATILGLVFLTPAIYLDAILFKKS